ncbi:hypothetical protein NUU61_004226 [Penicillium alfredii]|uniref:Thioesterase-like superfamily-domain-containing protein n=1 Tax=Penicillium alfredii TaxID=1506179 RepID=A0A9W9FKV2_9EURO|nr:uncharacterized protein NUU61_004226 [Penicillium alfredii]KAJ5102004.1 hypothetical protein NUU61_004226 [Penicillium alfredii]
MSPDSIFEEAIRVTPLGANTYAANLRPEWCIGTVAHGGYTTAVLYRMALTHFEYAHPTHYKEPATPISIQLSFLRRTAPGAATLVVDDVKLGLRTSTIHIKVLQKSEKQKNKLEVKIAGYITVSPASTEVGINAPTGWALHPASPGGSHPDGRVNLPVLGRTGRDGVWARLNTPYPETRQAESHTEFYTPGSAAMRQHSTGRILGDQWMRFRPGGDPDARWTNPAVVYVVDMFPMILDGLDSLAAQSMAQTDGDESSPDAQFWYPTISLNIDIKKRLPPQGVEWLYSRVAIKALRDGRTDLEITVLDEMGDVVALGTQVGLLVSASRNLGSRTKHKL